MLGPRLAILPHTQPHLQIRVEGSQRSMNTSGENLVEYRFDTSGGIPVEEIRILLVEFWMYKNTSGGIPDEWK